MSEIPKNIVVADWFLAWKNQQDRNHKKFDFFKVPNLNDRIVMTVYPLNVVKDIHVVGNDDLDRVDQ